MVSSDLQGERKMKSGLICHLDADETTGHNDLKQYERSSNKVMVNMDIETKSV